MEHGAKLYLFREVDGQSGIQWPSIETWTRPKVNGGKNDFILYIFQIQLLNFS
jgi:hypothetical protein